MNIQADWKGEHLIKAPEREPEGVDMKAVIDDKKPVRKKAKKTTACSVQSCTNLLSPNNTSSVCKGHIHARPYCQCIYCQGVISNDTA